MIAMIARKLVSFVGLRGMIGVAAGAALATAPAYQTGRWVESVAAEERLARVLAEHDAARMEAENARIGKALEARRRAWNRVSGTRDGRGLPDDGFRRD